MMRKEIRRRFLALVSVCLLALLSAPGQAHAEVDDYSLSLGLPYGALYAADQLNPVSVNLRNRTATAVRGDVRIAVAHDPTAMDLRVPITVPARASVKHIAWVYLPLPPESPKPGDKVPALSMPEWCDQRGARLSRTELVGQALTAETLSDPSGLPPTGYLLSLMGDTQYDTDAMGLDQLVTSYAAVRGNRCVTPAMGYRDAPRYWFGLSAVRVIALRGLDPDLLDPAQRAALIDFVRTGGTLLIAAPSATDRVEQSWLAPYLPVRLVGWRQMCQIELPSGSLKMLDWQPCSEAVEGDGHVYLRDADYVHAAWKPLGLGRVVYTSFPASALVPSDPRTNLLWRDLLAMDRLHSGMAGTMLQGNYGPLMEPMLGKPAAPWALAAGTTLAYLVVVLVVQMVWRGARRPTAFVVSLSLAVVVALAFVIMTAMKRQQESLQSARIAVVDLGQGGGKVSELIAFGGKDVPKMNLATAGQDVTLRPIYNSGQPVTVRQLPFVATEASVAAERVSLVWKAGNSLPSAWSVPAVARFGPAGLSLAVHNQTPLRLDAAQFVWQKERFAVGEIPQQERSLELTASNHRPVGEYTSTSGIASQDQRLKGEILAALLQSSDPSAPGTTSNTPFLVSWAEGLSPLVQPGEPVTQPGDQSLVRVPVLVQAPKRGDSILVDSWFTHVVSGTQRGLPYDFAHSEWLSSNMPGDWAFAVAAPPQAGRLQPQKVKIDLDLSASEHRVTIRQWQCAGKKGDGNPKGQIVAQWDGPLGAKTVQFNCDSRDFDDQGRVWLMLQVQPLAAPGAGLQPRWQIARFGVSIEALVQEPPAADVPGVLR